MIQILVCDKIYVTPEMKKKKLMYKIYFILSVFLVILLCSYYIYAEYDRAKSEQVSQEILAEIDFNKTNLTKISSENYEFESVTVEDDVIVVVLNDNTTEEINVDSLLREAQQQISENEANNSTIPVIYTASDGTKYYIIGTIKIPDLGIEYPILSDWNYEILKNATCKYCGADPNKVGNCCIIGHNYRNNSFFSKLDTLDIMDVIQITDTSGTTIEYAIYDKYVVDPDNTECTSQNTNGKREITLITCYNYGKQRTIIKATEI